MDYSLFNITQESSPSADSTSSFENQQTVFRIRPKSRSKPSEDATEGTPSVFRTRRAHTKSRAGCKNCKRRKIKCDESKPECDKCKGFRITCDYKTNVCRYVRGLPNIDPLALRNSPSHKQFTMSLSIAAASLNNLLEVGDRNAGIDGISYLEALTVSSVDLQVLHHFFSATCYTVGSPLAQEVARSDVMKIAMTQPYLMHSVLAVSSAHFRRLYPHQPTHRLAEIYHWQQAIVLFQRVISTPINVEEMDAVLSTCMLLCTLSLSTERYDPSSSWIFSSDPHGLGWLRQQSGLKPLLMELKEELPRSVWIPVFNDADDDFETYSDQRPGTAGLPHSFVELCGLDEASTVDNNPYHAPVRLLTPLIPLEGGIETFGKRISFMGRIRPGYFHLLEMKDPRALLILAYWLGQMSRLGQWWYYDRVRSECVAICMYLEALGDPRILPLLETPARDCGYPLRNIANTGSPDLLPTVVEAVEI